MCEPVIVVAGFSRARSLRRLLHSINRAHFPHDVVLVISLDGGAANNVINLANDFIFEKGRKEVVSRNKNLGLREHILWCGDQTEKYGSVIVLEDDLVVDPYFYYYARSALEYYGDEDVVGGVALYSPEYNEGAGLPFIPMIDNHTVYAMAIPCSWGQAWTSKQWSSFRKWYEGVTKEDVDKNQGLPMHVKKWPESSWKKYFAAYLVDESKWFVYPYRSYTTNYSDAGGVHIKRKSFVHQVALADKTREKDLFVFFDVRDDSFVFYDAYMEAGSEALERSLGLPCGSLIIDLYGIKSASQILSREYCLTTKEVREKITGFDLGFRPVENCVYYGEVGDGVSLALSRDVVPRSKPQCFHYEYWLRVSLFSKKFMRIFLFCALKRLINELKSRAIGRKIEF